MKVTVKGELLTATLRRMKLTATPINPAHALVKIEARERRGPDEPARLVFTSTAGVLSLNTSIDADVKEPGLTAVNTSKILAASGAMPLGDVLLQTAGTKISLRGSSGRSFTTTTADPSIVQPTPEPKSAEWLSVGVDVLKGAIERVGYVTSDVEKFQDERAGVRLEATAGSLCAVACGNFMIASLEQATDKVTLKAPRWEGLLPTQGLSAIGDILAEATEMKAERIELYVDAQMLYVVGPATLLVAALPVGDYPPWRNALSAFLTEPTCAVPRLALMESIKACQATGSPLDPGGMIHIGKKQMDLFREGEDEFRDHVPLINMAPNTEMTFKCGLPFLFSMLKGADGDADFFFDSEGRGLLVRAGGYRAAVPLMDMPKAEPPEKKK